MLTRFKWLWAPVALLLTAGGLKVDLPDLNLRITRQLNKYLAEHAPQKVYLHTDRSVYTTGETVWYKANLVWAFAHQPDTLTGVLYVDLISPDARVVSQRVLQVRNGTAQGDFLLADSLQTGTYRVRAYTNWMRNFDPDFFFTKELMVWQTAGEVGLADTNRVFAAPVAKPPDVQFFPEGGDLVQNLESKVAFKATDSLGNGVPVEGQVLNEQETVITRFESLHRGMGFFLLRPGPGTRYTAKVRLAGGPWVEHALPAAQPAGFVMRFGETDRYIVIHVQQNVAPAARQDSVQKITLAAHLRGVLL